MTSPHPKMILLTYKIDVHPRGHAVFEQIFAGSIDGPLAHLPSPDFSASAAWVTLAAMTQDILRAAGALASLFHAKARCATLRRDLISVPATTARTGRGTLTLRGVRGWYAGEACLACTLRPGPGRAAPPPPRPDPPGPGHRTRERPAAAAPPPVPGPERSPHGRAEAGGGTFTPAITWENPSGGKQAENDLRQFVGGSRLSNGVRTVIVPTHRGAVPTGTLASILRQAGISADDPRKLL
jgi:hypothetical protein